MKGARRSTLPVEPAWELSVEMASAKSHACLIPLISSLDAFGDSLWISSISKGLLFSGGVRLLSVNEESVEARGHRYWGQEE